ncbi:phage holin family protein [Salipaludibacillus sp. CF4.18]|uniref:phage holin family protein n=1 Tax=Salipaludibacillus sp. CF4.18 TaxID=3373081 RepID=UPI003EE52A0A
MDLINYAKVITAGGAFVLSYLFGEWSVLLGTLIFFVSFDYVSGVTAAAYKGKLNAQVGFWGIPKKIMIFGLVAISYQIDMVYLELMGSSIAIGDLNVSVMGATILYYLVNEFISITENLGKMGMKVPTPLEKAIEVFQSKSYYQDKQDQKGDEE